MLEWYLNLLGFEIKSDTPICPVIVGSSENAQMLSSKLLEAGIFGRAIVYPTVPVDKARVRIMLSAAHTQTHLDQCIEAFQRIGKEMGLI